MEYTISLVLVFLFILFYRRERNRYKSVSFEQMNHDIEEISYVWKQRIADMELERNAYREAEDLFKQYKMAKERHDFKIKINPDLDKYIKFCPLIFATPRAHFIIEYPNQTSKYDSNSYKELRNKRYRELVEGESQII